MKQQPDLSNIIAKRGAGRTAGTLFVALCVVAIALSLTLPHGSRAADDPTAVPTDTGTPGATGEPGTLLTPQPEAGEPTAVPTETLEPTAVPTETLEPTAVPTETLEPTAVPTETLEPTTVPTETLEPTLEPTTEPTAMPTATPAAGHPMGCQPGEVFIDAQDWWSTTPGAFGQDGTPGNDFGHLHTSLCFPYKATVTGEMTLRIRSTMHHNPGQFSRLTVQLFAPKAPDATTSCDSYAVACVVFKPPRTCPIDQTCRWEDVLTFNTADIAYDGWQDIRVRGTVKEPDGKDMHTSTGLRVYVKNGHPIQDIGANPDEVVARGWYTGAGYATASILPPPTGPVSGVWEPVVKLDQGAGGIPVTGHYAALDTDFHNGNPGIPVLQGEGPYRGTLRIDTNTLGNGWHRLLLKTNAFDPITGSTHSGILAILFEVLN